MNTRQHVQAFAGAIQQEASIATTPPLRVATRPEPAQWGHDELFTFVEAGALLWPDGPLSASSMRTAYRTGALWVMLIARKIAGDQTRRTRWQKRRPIQSVSDQEP